MSTRLPPLPLVRASSSAVHSLLMLMVSCVCGRASLAGVRAFASAAGIDFSGALGGRTVPARPAVTPKDADSVSSSSSREDGASEGEGGKGARIPSKNKRRVAKTDKRAHKRSHGGRSKDKHASSEEEGTDNAVYVIDTAPDRDNLR